MHASLHRATYSQPQFSLVYLVSCHLENCTWHIAAFILYEWPCQASTGHRAAHMSPETAAPSCLPHALFPSSCLLPTPSSLLMYAPEHNRSSCLPSLMQAGQAGHEAGGAPHAQSPAGAAVRVPITHSRCSVHAPSLQPHKCWQPAGHFDNTRHLQCVLS